MVKVRSAGAVLKPKSPTVQADLVIDAIQAGSLNNAITIIGSHGVAPLTSEVIKQIRELLTPQPPRPIYTHIDGEARGIPEVTPTDIASTLRRAPKRTARDVFGWAYEHLQLLLGHPTESGAHHGLE